MTFHQFCGLASPFSSDMTNRFEKLNDLPQEIADARYYRHFRFAGFGGDSFCTILLVRKQDDALVVVCSQIPGAVGTSVTNGLEAIGAQLGEEIPPTWRETTPLWFEHYPTGAGMLVNRYTLMQVTFEQGSPSWSSLISWKQAEKLSKVSAKILAHGYEEELE